MTTSSTDPVPAGSILSEQDGAGPPAWSAGTAGAVVRGPAPAGTVTLADLADPRTGSSDASGPGDTAVDRLVRLMAPHSGGVRQATISTIHHALATVHRVVIDPFGRDRLLVEAGPTQVGFVVGPEVGDLRFWVGAATVRSCADGAAAGTVAGGLLWPVIHAIRRRARVGAAGLELLALDSLTRRLERLDPSPSPGWATSFLAATGLRSSVTRRTIAVSVDAGAPIEVPIPRVCCVLQARLTPGACPTCPNRADDVARREATADWLRIVTDEHFEEITGRPRARPVQAGV